MVTPFFTFSTFLFCFLMSRSVAQVEIQAPKHWKTLLLTANESLRQFVTVVVPWISCSRGKFVLSSSTRTLSGTQASPLGSANQSRSVCFPPTLHVFAAVPNAANNSVRVTVYTQPLFNLLANNPTKQNEIHTWSRRLRECGRLRGGWLPPRHDRRSIQ